jgi:hypothetical protein
VCAAWLLAAVTCDAANLPVVANGTFTNCRGRVAVKARCKATCSSGFKNRPEVTCLSTGAWGKLSTTCVPVGKVGSCQRSGVKCNGVDRMVLARTCTIVDVPYS